MVTPSVMVIRGPEENCFVIPRLYDNGRTIANGFHLSTEIRVIDGYTFPDYLANSMFPTPAELVWAMFGKIGKRPVCPHLLRILVNETSMCPQDACGEYTNAVIKGSFLVERPSLRYMGEKLGWEIEGGNPKKIEFKIPDEGWVLKFDPNTGIPMKTTGDAEKALRGRKHLGIAPYFMGLPEEGLKHPLVLVRYPYDIYKPDFSGLNPFTLGLSRVEDVNCYDDMTGVRQLFRNYCPICRLHF